jgi:hypothetical protein
LFPNSFVVSSASVPFLKLVCNRNLLTLPQAVPGCSFLWRAHAQFEGQKIGIKINKYSLVNRAGRCCFDQTAHQTGQISFAGGRSRGFADAEFPDLLI